MTLFAHELRRGRLALVIWSAAICGLLLVCVVLYPEIKSQMAGMTRLFASMGAFTAAFGMDRLDFGTAMGFYGIECGNVLGLGGSMFAALLGANALSGEEAAHTAEFLLTHPIRRGRIAAEKLLAALAQILVLNLVAAAVAYAGLLGIGESVPLPDFLNLHAAWLGMQLEIACLAFGLSPFLRGGMGAGLGLALGLYFLNLVANISAQADFLHWITPFAYCEAANVLADGHPDLRLMALGLAYALIAAAVARRKFLTKDITA